MSKFVCGDLVTLSASGRKRNHNSTVLGMIGIIVAVRKHCYPIQIKWIGLSDSPHSNITDGDDIFPMKEYEIKFVKNGVVPCK